MFLLLLLPLAPHETSPDAPIDMAVSRKWVKFYTWGELWEGYVKWALNSEK